LQHHNNLRGSTPALRVQPSMAQPEQSKQPWEYTLRKYLLLLATLVVNVTYAAGFNPPGGVWQEDPHNDGQRLAGDPIIRDIHYRRYLAFFYCNATAFAASLVVIMLILILAVRHDKEKEKEKKDAVQVIKPLRAFMVLDLLSLVGAYAAGTCRDRTSIVYTAVLVAAVFAYIVVLKLLDRCFPEKNSGSSSSVGMPNSETNNGTVPAASVIPAADPESDRKVEEKESRKRLKTEERLCKVLMLLATFAVSITYVAGLSTPGGFWDSTGGSHRPGDVILRDHHSTRLTVFLLFNTTAFVASLLIAVLLIIDGKKLRDKTARFHVLYVCIFVALVGLIGVYAAGSCRKTDTTAYVVSLVGAVLAYILLHGFYTWYYSNSALQTDENQQTGDRY
uniref:PGG domain-containing protein n=1 Tax=Aegilops tauschii subsp. strangulata TaxID=200361 RepID=A0A453PXI6_AEGTS